MNLDKIKKLKDIWDDPKAKKIAGWFFQILVAIAFGILVGMFFFQGVTMEEGSMEPTYSPGDTFFVNRAAYRIGDPKRGDIIVFRTSPEDDASLHIKRVIGLPGETVQIKDGQVLIDGATYREGRDLPLISNPGLAEDAITLQAGEYFVLGDNRNNSEDSRYVDVGNVQKKYIVGRAWFQSGPIRSLGSVE